MNKELKSDNLYHACRLAFCAGHDKIPWHFVLHAIREGIGIESSYKLGPLDYQAYPDLEHLVNHLKGLR